MNGAKVSLRSKSIADARRDYLWQKDPELMGFSGNPPLKESFLEYLAQSMASYKPSNYVEIFAIRTLDNNRHIGNCALYEIDRENSSAQLGITIGERDFWSKGFGEDAVKLLAHYAFETLGLQRLWLKTLEDNTRALRCFQKSGFNPCGSIFLVGHHYTLMEKFNQANVNKGVVQD